MYDHASVHGVGWRAGDGPGAHGTRKKAPGQAPALLRPTCSDETLARLGLCVCASCVGKVHDMAMRSRVAHRKRRKGKLR